MTINSFLLGLARRWYVVLAGLLLTGVAAAFLFSNTSPTYSRSASQLIVPTTQSLPDGQNVFLNLGGLAQASEVLVVTLNSEGVKGPIVEANPGTSITVARDVSTSGPIISIVVEGENDSAVETAFDSILDEIAPALVDLQDEAGVPQASRLGILPLTADSSSVISQKGRIATAGVVGAGGFAATLLVAALIDGLVLARRRRHQSPDLEVAPEREVQRTTERANTTERAEVATSKAPSTKTSFPPLPELRGPSTPAAAPLPRQTTPVQSLPPRPSRQPERAEPTPPQSGSTPLTSGARKVVVAKRPSYQLAANSTGLLVDAKRRDAGEHRDESD